MGMYIYIHYPSRFHFALWQIVSCHPLKSIHRRKGIVSGDGICSDGIYEIQVSASCTWSTTMTERKKVASPWKVKHIYLVVEPNPFNKICSPNLDNLPQMFRVNIKCFWKPTPRYSPNGDWICLQSNPGKKDTKTNPTGEISADHWKMQIPLSCV